VVEAGAPLGVGRGVGEVVEMVVEVLAAHVVVEKAARIGRP
jgi:hypothetical protein